MTILHGSISRRHADGDFVLTDMGCQINGQQVMVRKRPLRHDDIVMIGHSSFEQEPPGKV